MSVATVHQLDSDGVVDVWSGLLPGPELGARLAGVDLADLCDDELLQVMAAWRRQSSWASAGELAAAAELVSRRDPGRCWDQVKAAEFVADEVGLALRVTGNAAGALLSLALMLTGRLPRTWAALQAGRIDVARAKVISEGLLGVSDEVAAQVEGRVFPQAEGLTTGQLRYRVRQAIVEVDPDAAEERRKEAVKGRRLELGHTPAGTCDLIGRDLPTEVAEAAYNRLTAAAHAMAADGDQRPIDTLRADLYLDLLRGTTLANAARDLVLTGHGDEAPAGPVAPQRAGGRFDAKPVPPKYQDADPEAVAALSCEVAALIADLVHAQLTSATRGKGRGTAFAANAAAQSLADSLAELKVRWCAAINGPVRNASGGHGHDGYRPPAAMRRSVQADYGRCAFPTCRRNATRCDLDHTTAWQKYGATCFCNLAPLCRHHHRLKQEPGWTLLQLWPGVLVWITPAGHWHLVTPTDRE